MNGLDKRGGESGRAGGVCGRVRAVCQVDAITGSLVSGSVGEESSEKIFLNIYKKKSFQSNSKYHKNLKNKLRNLHLGMFKNYKQISKEYLSKVTNV